MANFGAAFDYLMTQEGGLEEDQKDPGGITNRGISLQFLKGLSVDQLVKYHLPPIIDATAIKDLTLDQTYDLYLGQFWQTLPFGDIKNQRLANYLFDTCVNIGQTTAIKCLQHAIWCIFGHMGEVIDDGILGVKTLRVVNQYPESLISPLRAERAAYYRLEVERHPEKQKWLKGWLMRSYGTGE